MPETANAKIRVQPAGSVTVVAFNDRRILEESVIGRIAEELNRLLDNPQPLHLLLDFNDVEHLSSAALGMLIILNSNVRRRGGRLKMCHLKPDILEVFEITRLNKLFEIYDDTQQAVAGFQRGS